jgi:YD repeat-containing protein
VLETDPGCQLYSFIDDTKGNLKTVTNPLDDVTIYTYNTNGTLATVKDANDGVTEFKDYDTNGYPQTIVNPLGVAPAPPMFAGASVGVGACWAVAASGVDDCDRRPFNVRCCCRISADSARLRSPRCGAEVRVPVSGRQRWCPTARACATLPGPRPP